jgi:hypothetical protein
MKVLQLVLEFDYECDGAYVVIDPTDVEFFVGRSAPEESFRSFFERTVAHAMSVSAPVDVRLSDAAHLAYELDCTVEEIKRIEHGALQTWSREFVDPSRGTRNRMRPFLGEQGVE